MPKKQDKQSADQSKAFIEKAREIGCDEDPASFDKMLKRIGSASPPKSVEKRKAKKLASRA